MPNLGGETKKFKGGYIWLISYYQIYETHLGQEYFIIFTFFSKAHLKLMYSLTKYNEENTSI